METGLKCVVPCLVQNSQTVQRVRQSDSLHTVSYTQSHTQASRMSDTALASLTSLIRSSCPPGSTAPLPRCQTVLQTAAAGTLLGLPLHLSRSVRACPAGDGDDLIGADARLLEVPTNFEALCGSGAELCIVPRLLTFPERVPAALLHAMRLQARLPVILSGLDSSSFE